MRMDWFERDHLQRVARGVRTRSLALLRSIRDDRGALRAWLEAPDSRDCARRLLDELLEGARPVALTPADEQAGERARDLLRQDGEARYAAEQRLTTALGYFQGPFRELARWALLSAETTNFTYSLTALNRDQLAAFLAAVAGAPEARCLAYMAELEQDDELRAHLRARAASSSLAGDAEPRYGRRMGWYALVRLLRPGLVVETGVHRGLGTAVLAAALRRNAAEGAPGTVIGTDIDPRAGALLGPPYDQHGRVVHGDSLSTLRALDRPIGLFVNDSDHRSSYERAEYEAIEPLLASDALVLSDNAHCTNELHEFARRTGRRYLFFSERPQDHWYPGAGIGAAYPA